jgi:hypothetical protein
MGGRCRRASGVRHEEGDAIAQAVLPCLEFGNTSQCWQEALLSGRKANVELYPVVLALLTSA